MTCKGLSVSPGRATEVLPLPGGNPSISSCLRIRVMHALLRPRPWSSSPSLLQLLSRTHAACPETFPPLFDTRSLLARGSSRLAQSSLDGQGGGNGSDSQHGDRQLQSQSPGPLRIPQARALETGRLSQRDRAFASSTPSHTPSLAPLGTLLPPRPPSLLSQQLDLDLLNGKVDSRGASSESQC